MSPFFPWSKRRLIAVDCGSRCVKLLLVEVHGHTPVVVNHKLVDLQEEGLLATEEIQHHLTACMSEWGEWPLAVTLPAHLSFSEVVDLPANGTEADIPKIIEEQTARLRGLSSSPLVYDAVRLSPHGRLHQPYHITIAREEDVENHLKRITANVNEVRAVSGVANALLGATRLAQPDFCDGVVVDLGAGVTTVVIICEGQGLFASSFAVGGNTFIEAVAKARKLTAAEAENQMRSGNLFSGSDQAAGLGPVVDAWLAELRRLVENWRRQHGAWLAGNQPVPVLLSGGITQMPGLLPHLQDQPGFVFTGWPEPPENARHLPRSDYVLAFGAALEAVRRAGAAPSLLPPRLQTHAQRLRQGANLNLACVGFLLLVALLLGGATWQKAARWNQKRGQTQRAETVLAQIQELDTLTRQRDRAFEQYWPLLDRQERTVDLLRTLRLLQEARAQNDFWSVLLADNDSYARGSTLPVAATNRFGLTNTPVMTEESLAKPSFVVELCVPAAGDQTLKVVNDLVAGLRKDPLFSRVDSVPASQRRVVADPKVLIPDRHFALSLDVADSGWRNLFQSLRPVDLRNGTNTSRRYSPPFTPRSRMGPQLPLGPSPAPPPAP